MLLGGTLSYESCCDGRTDVVDVHKKSTSATAFFPERQIRGTKFWCMLVTHNNDCLESRPKMENSCWMEHDKIFAIFLWRTYTGKKSPVLHPKNLNFHISSMFLYLILAASFNEYSNKSFNASWNLFPK